MSEDFLAKPEGLTAEGEKAYETVMAVLKKYNALDTGGCKAFYSPAEWRNRGEEYAGGSELVIVYDGGDLKHFFSMDACYYDNPHSSKRYDRYEEMQAALNGSGLYFEEGTSWYSGVYKN